MQGFGTVCVSTAKSGLGPDLAGMSRTHLAVLLHWGTETSERVTAENVAEKFAVLVLSSWTCYIALCLLCRVFLFPWNY
jgi:hypothetical protein